MNFSVWIPCLIRSLKVCDPWVFLLTLVVLPRPWLGFVEVYWNFFHIPNIVLDLETKKIDETNIVKHKISPLDVCYVQGVRCQGDGKWKGRKIQRDL